MICLKKTMQIFLTRPTCLAKFETPDLECGPVGTHTVSLSNSAACLFPMCMITNTWFGVC